jgi:mono/diheme cytochrome c family protein
MTITTLPTLRAAALLLLSIPLSAQGPGATGARPRGVSVTFEPLDPDAKAKEGSHTVRERLLALAVERGETPTPMLSPGMFQATLRAVLPLPARDRIRFQIQGKGSAKLVVNGEPALAGALRPGKPLETQEPLRLKKGDNELVCTIESNAQGEAQLRVAWSGSTFAWEPIPPDLLQWPDDEAIVAGERMRRGHQLFVDRRCAQCHQPERPLGESAFRELDQKGPDLRAVGARVHAGWIAKWLLDPRALRPEATMPKLPLENAGDAQDIAACLAQMGSPLPAPKFAPADVERGGVRFRELGCIACHVPPELERDPVAGSRRIALRFVRSKWHPAALVQYLLDPGREFPDVRMPHFALEPEDGSALAAYLTQNADPPPPPKGDVDKGRRLLTRHGCDRCHQLTVPETGNRYQEVRALRGDRGCLASQPPREAPDFGFDADQLAAVRAFLPRAEAASQRRSPLDYAARMVPALRCTNCHGRDSDPSVWARVVAAAEEKAPVPVEQNPVAQGLPALTWVGAKLQPGWMERFVSGREKSPRPWLHARMPSFGDRGAAIVQGLLREHGYPAQDEQEQAPDNQLAAAGARLVKMGEGLGCVQCHGVGSQPPTAVFERQGVNFAVASKRLRKEYFIRWLLDPVRIDPDAKMPKYADAKGMTPLTEVLGGDARQQFEAVWNWFRTLE